MFASLYETETLKSVNLRPLISRIPTTFLIMKAENGTNFGGKGKQLNERGGDYMDKAFINHFCTNGFCILGHILYCREDDM